MILVYNDYDIPNFLSALGFIAPKGYDVDYIVAPEDTDETIVKSLNNNGFIEEVDPNYKNVRYMKKDPKLAHSFPAMSLSPESEAASLAEFPRTIAPTDTVTLASTLHNTLIKSPVSGIQILENTKTEATIMLKEQMYSLPKHTLVHIVKEI